VRSLTTLQPRTFLAAAGLAGLAGGLWLAIRDTLDLQDRVVVITGGSRGLGLLLARRFAAEGARVAILARDMEELDRAAKDLRRRGAHALPVPCDVRDREHVEEAMRRVVSVMGRIDVLVNNAGIIQVGPLEHMTTDDFEDALAVHVMGPLYTTLAALPHLKKQAKARIVNIASIGGKLAVPHLLPYSASKFGLVGLSEGLRVELMSTGIKVTTVCPGLMRTGSPPHAMFKGQHRAEHAWFAIGDALPLVSIDADRAAAKIVRATKAGVARLIITPQARVMSLLNEVAPGIMSAAMGLVNRFLPAATPDRSPDAKTGADSASPWAPSWLTALSDSASLRNNEVVRSLHHKNGNGKSLGESAD
jgi:NAD(P)-dependent dehydrogenase (short-subunit alcohol dehydrogenase family)